jgi:hypothetical protein
LNLLHPETKDSCDPVSEEHMLNKSTRTLYSRDATSNQTEEKGTAYRSIIIGFFDREIAVGHLQYCIARNNKEFICEDNNMVFELRT